MRSCRSLRPRQPLRPSRAAFTLWTSRADDVPSDADFAAATVVVGVDNSRVRAAAARVADACVNDVVVIIAAVPAGRICQVLGDGT